jgi:very-short-patch-repair endonuclease
MADLMRLAGSELERRWLRFLDERRLRLPSRAQPLVEECGTRPDFLYDKALAAVYIDGPVHDYPDRHERDRAQTACMEDLGYTVIRFHHADEWEGVVARYPHIFGAQG